MKKRDFRTAMSLVKGHYEKGDIVVALECGECRWNTGRLKVIGVDSHEELLQKGKEEKYLDSYCVADAKNTALPKEFCEIITAFSTSELAGPGSDENLIQEAQRILKPGGMFILCLQKPSRFEAVSKALQSQGFDIEDFFSVRTPSVFICAKKQGAGSRESHYADLTVILPTLNEEKNIGVLLTKIFKLYPEINIIVSDDGSSDATRKIAEGFGDRVRFLDRREKPVHGLTASLLDATVFVRTPYWIVMDADGQHPPEKIREMANHLRLGALFVVASRVKVEAGWGFLRKALSGIGTLIGKTCLLMKGKDYITYDILGGLFGCNTRFWRKSMTFRFKKEHFRLRGYKILFDFLKYLPSRLAIEEVYYEFKTRKADNTKINFEIQLEYLKSCFLP